MTKEGYVTDDERRMGALAHGSIMLGVFTSGIGGIFAAMVIWITQREKSAYIAYQSLQAMVYQTIILLASVIGFCIWGLAATLLVVLPMAAEPDLYLDTPPATIWFSMVLLIFPCSLWLGTILYGLWGAIRCLAGADFRYAIIGNWLVAKA